MNSIAGGELTENVCLAGCFRLLGCVEQEVETRKCRSCTRRVNHHLCRHRLDGLAPTFRFTVHELENSRSRADRSDCRYTGNSLVPVWFQWFRQNPNMTRASSMSIGVCALGVFVNRVRLAKPHSSDQRPMGGSDDGGSPSRLV